MDGFAPRLNTPARFLMTVASALALTSVVTGCQSTIGGQTLPSAYYLRDDIQYFPAGPEFKLTKQVEALEEYKLRQLGTPEVQP